MITKEKLKIYERYGRNADAFSHAGQRDKELVSYDDIYLIENLLQDLYLVRRKLASPGYATALIDKLVELCDNAETIHYLKEMALTSNPPLQ